MKKTSTISLALSIACIGLIGCNAESGNKALLSDIDYIDNGVKLCVERHAREESWLTVEDVARLDCTKTSKAQVVYYDEGIWVTSDLEQFTSLEYLDLSGNHYTEFDPSSLTELNELHMEMSFIKSLDLSKNIQLEVINVSSTLLTDLNLRFNPLMREVRATTRSYHTEQYQIWSIEGLDSQLEEDSLPYSWGNELRGITLASIVEREVTITLDAAAPISILNVDVDTTIIELSIPL